MLSSFMFPFPISLKKSGFECSLLEGSLFGNSFGNILFVKLFRSIELQLPCYGTVTQHLKNTAFSKYSWCFYI